MAHDDPNATVKPGRSYQSAPALMQVGITLPTAPSEQTGRIGSPPPLASPGLAMSGGDAPAKAGATQGNLLVFACIEEQIAFYKAELRITNAQLPKWNAFPDALRNGARPYGRHVQPIQSADDACVVAQMDRQVSVLSTTLDSLKQIETAGKPLSAGLLDDREKAADEPMVEHFWRM